jgi:hypothetical protein
MKRFAPLLVIWCLSFGFSESQNFTSLGFTDISGIPQVLTDGQQLNLSGYIRNDGNTASLGAVDIYLSINGNVESVQNNFLIGGSLQPGDSVLWNYNGYVFNNTIMSPGHNDILIWPTSPSSNPNADSKSDTLLKHTFLADEAAFRMSRDMVKGLEEGEPFEQDVFYQLKWKTINAGIATSSESIKFFFQFEGCAPIMIGEVSGAYAPGDSVELEWTQLPGFRLNDFIQQYCPTVEKPDWVRFWAQEKMEVPPVSWADFEVLGPVNTPSPSAYHCTVYPNPSSGKLFVTLEGVDHLSITKMEIVDGAGKPVRSGNSFSSELDLHDISGGLYFLKIFSGNELLLVKEFSVNK